MQLTRSLKYGLGLAVLIVASGLGNSASAQIVARHAYHVPPVVVYRAPVVAYSPVIPAPPAVVAYSPVAPVAVAPVAVAPAPVAAYRPVPVAVAPAPVVAVPAPVVVYRPRYFVPGQPIRNAFRAIIP